MATSKITKHRKDFKDISGKRFGKLTVVSFHETRGKNSYWLCRCDCGTEKYIAHPNLKQGTKSCGCATNQFKHRTHGMHASPTYKSWASAKQRCANPNATGFEEYGGSGIKMCARWANSFEDFLADMGTRPKGKTLDRINNAKGYEPGNCRWATAQEQQENRRDFIRVIHEGESLSLFELAERTGFQRSTLWERYRKGLPLLAPLRRIIKRRHTG